MDYGFHRKILHGMEWKMGIHKKKRLITSCSMLTFYDNYIYGGKTKNILIIMW